MLRDHLKAVNSPDVEKLKDKDERHVFDIALLNKENQALLLQCSV